MRLRRKYGSPKSKSSVPLWQVGRPEAFTESDSEALGEPIHQFLAVTRAFLAMLLDLDDLPADEPVGVNHGRVRRARDMATRVLDNLGDPLEHFLFSTIGELCHCEAAPRGLISINASIAYISFRWHLQRALQQ